MIIQVGPSAREYYPHRRRHAGSKNKHDICVMSDKFTEENALKWV